MKTLTIEQFENLIKTGNWERDQTIEVTDNPTRQIEEWDEDTETLNVIDIPTVYGYAWMTSTLDNISITYTEAYSYDEFNANSFGTSNEGVNDVWQIEGIEVVDDDGDALDDELIGDLITEITDDFSSIDYSEIDFDQTNDIDIDEESDMETYTLEIDNEPNIRFTGELIAEVSSSPNNASGSYSGSVGRWTELALYRTAGGKYVCYQVGRTQWQGENDRHTGAVCETEQEVIEFFGHRWLAKELYEKAHIDDVTDIE